MPWSVASRSGASCVAYNPVTGQKQSPTIFPATQCDRGVQSCLFPGVLASSLPWPAWPWSVLRHYPTPLRPGGAVHGVAGSASASLCHRWSSHPPPSTLMRRPRFTTDRLRSLTLHRRRAAGCPATGTARTGCPHTGRKVSNAGASPRLPPGCRPRLLTICPRNGSKPSGIGVLEVARSERPH